MSKTPWELMLTGNRDEALNGSAEAYARKTTAPETIDLGAAYLWLGEYVAAWEHFKAANKKQPNHSAAVL